uniref:Retrotransposon gag domain-containing protein n=1 Tax=Vitis vinifera TaxID=29760 RepID=A5B8G3_VITVI|nr:hypothetical protein VITISV_020970 [Vitis vinifera]
MKRFMVMQPPSFNGEPSAEAVEHWLRRMRRILVGLDIPEERRVSLAAYMLIDKADFWWESMKRVYDTEVMTWEEFERIFLGKYFGEQSRNLKAVELDVDRFIKDMESVMRRPVHEEVTVDVDSEGGSSSDMDFDESEDDSNKDAAYKEISWLNERSFGRTKSETSYTDGGAFHISSHTFHTEEAIHAH